MGLFLLAYTWLATSSAEPRDAADRVHNHARDDALLDHLLAEVDWDQFGAATRILKTQARMAGSVYCHACGKFVLATTKCDVPKAYTHTSALLRAATITITDDDDTDTDDDA
jgi:hypothetical protein